jgi:hypothetical protein
MPTEGDTDNAVAAAEVEVLQEENQRLREQFQQAKQTTYRRTVLAFLGIGVLALGGAALFPDERTLLAAFGGTGLFAAILTYFITPEEFHAASVSEQIYTASARNGQALVSELGLQDHRIYVPVGEKDVRLYCPAHREFMLPDAHALRSTFVVTDDQRERGLALSPTGGGLYSDVEMRTGETAELESVAAQLADAIVEQFELAHTVSVDVVPASKEARFEITGSSCGQIQSFDQPIVSLLATGIAVHTGEPVAVEFTEDASDGIVRCLWD